jgi:tetratricopeptide (TPR) repeat protein
MSALSVLRPLRRHAMALCLLALAGCASLVPPAVDSLLHDSLYGHPARPDEADSVLALSPAMQAHLQALRNRAGRTGDLPLALAESLYSPGGLQLDYDASSTRNAAQAFAARSGNCLSLVVMTAALAGALGLEVGFREVLADEQFRRAGGLTLRSGHVNLVLGGRDRPPAWRPARADLVHKQLVIDFLPQESARALPAVPIPLGRVLAMFMNNRAVEALLAQQPAAAYAWARESLRTDPGFAAAANTLGVVYQRAGHLVPAAAAYERVLVLDARHVAAMDNLAQVRHAQGREAEALAWEQRRAALEPHAPFHFLRLGQAALAAQDWLLARRHFQRELRSQPESHEAWFGLARAQLALGDTAQAEQALRQAQQASATTGERARYAGKLDALRAAAAH